jgi:hypothetical protein
VLLQTVLVLKDVLRRFPDAAAPYANTLQTLPVADLQTNEAVAAYFWIRAQLTCMGILEEEGVEPVRSTLPSSYKTDVLLHAGRVYCMGQFQTIARAEVRLTRAHSRLC